MKHDKTFEAIAKLKDIEIELRRLKTALEITNKALDASVLAEREACAKVCDQMFHDWCNQEFEDEDEAYRNKPDAEDCKKAIRARGEK